MFYSKSTGGFYDLEVNGADIPTDAVEITDAQHTALLAAQAAGSSIQADASGKPIAVAPSAPTLAQVQAANEVAIQTALDAEAQSRGYTDIKSACAYASTVPAVPSTNANFAVCEKFRLEGNALQSWMSLTWATAYAYLATVTAGTNPMPTAAEAVAMIPAFTWPD